LILLTISVFRFPTDQLRLSFQLLAEFGSILALSWFLWRVNKWMALFMVSVCLSSMYPQYDTATFFATHSVLFGMVWYYFVYTTCDVDSLLNTFCVIALVNVLFLVLQFFNVAPFMEPLKGGRDICTGLMANPNEVSAVLAFCFPAFLRKKWMYLIPLVLLGIALSESFGGALAVIIGGAYFLWNKIDKRFIGLGFLITIGLFLAIDIPGFTHRFETWVVALRLYSEHWILGSGIGHWKYVFANINVADMGVRMDTAHNEFVQGIFEMGVPFILILIGFMYSWIKKLKKSDKIFTVAAICIVINCAVNFPLHIAVTAYMILTWLAVIDRKAYGNKR